MKADTYARLLVLQALVEADTAYLIKGQVGLSEIREGLIARLGDVVEQVDTVDQLAAGRVYDAIVDLLAEMPNEGRELMIEATVRFQRAIDHVVERGVGTADFNSRSIWAFALIELTETVADLFHESDELDERNTLFLHALMRRIAAVGERLAALVSDDDRHELKSDLDRLMIVLANGRARMAEVDTVLRPLQTIGARWRPSSVRRMGRFVLKQLFRRHGSKVAPSSLQSPAQPNHFTR